jgi:hypothetical protein
MRHFRVRDFRPEMSGIINNRIVDTITLYICYFMQHSGFRINNTLESV